MFLWIFLFFLSLDVFNRAAAVPQDPHSMKATCKRYPLPMCTREYDPVCGSDGMTYPNKCMLCLKNLHYLDIYMVKKGEC